VIKILLITTLILVGCFLPSHALAATDFSNYSKLWSVPITNNLSPYLFRTEPVANSSGMVFAASEKRVIGATNTGVKIWEYNDGDLYPQLTLVDEKVIVIRSGSYNQLIALNQADGKVIWQTPIFTDTNILVQSNPGILGNRIFIAFNAYNPARPMLKTFDVATGKETRSVNDNKSQFQFSSLAGLILTDFALPHQYESASKVFIALQQGYLASVSKTMLSVKVDRTNLGPFPEAPVLSNDDNYLMTASESVLRYSTINKDGTASAKILWTADLGKIIRARPLLTTGYAIVNAGGSGQPGEIVAVSLKDGKVAWRKSLDFGVSTTPTLFDEQTLILSADKLYFLDLASGDTLSNFQLDHKLGNRFSSPASVGVKTFLVDKDGNLVCFGPPIAPHHPAIFVHGLGGSPADWEVGGNKEGYKIKLLEEYRKDQPEFPADWLVSYSYAGTDPRTGGYNSGGRIEEVAADFEKTVATLSASHLKQGGNGQVDVVAFSMGGLVTREYMASHSEETHLRKVITIGTPHQGSFIADFVNGVNTLKFKFLSDQFHELAKEVGLEEELEAPALEDIFTQANYLNKLKERKVEDTVILDTVAGDLSLQIEQGVLFYNIQSTPVDVGDLVVSRFSATTTDPVYNNKKLTFSQNLPVPLSFIKDGSNVGIRAQVPRLASLNYFHLLLPRQPEVQESVVKELVGIPEEDALRV